MTARHDADFLKAIDETMASLTEGQQHVVREEEDDNRIRRLVRREVAPIISWVCILAFVVLWLVFRSF